MAIKTEEQIQEEIAESRQRQKQQYVAYKPRCYVGNHYNGGRGKHIESHRRAKHATGEHGDQSRISKKAQRAKAENVQKITAERAEKKSLLKRIFSRNS